MLLGNELAPFAKQKANQSGLPKGCIFNNGNLKIWVKQWSEVLEEARLRYEFFREELDIEAATERGMKTFSEDYQELLTGRGKRKGKETRRSNGP